MNQQCVFWPLCSNAYQLISALSVSVKIWCSFRFLSHVWSPCFSYTHFMLPLASRFATSLIPMSSLLGSSVAGLKYLRMPVLLLIKNRVWSATKFISSPLLLTPHVCYPHLPGATPTNQYILNCCDLSFEMLSALSKFVNVKFKQNIIALRYEPLPGKRSRGVQKAYSLHPFAVPMLNLLYYLH